MIKRKNSPSTKGLCIITLTRIFLTHNHQSLIREITTPALPSFVASCHHLAQAAEHPSALQLIALHALCELIKLHSTRFRPFMVHLQKLTLSLIAYTPSEASPENQTRTVPTSVADGARSLFVLLHMCGPKTTAGNEWTQSFQSTLATAQRTADRVFRAVVEDWEPTVENATVANTDSVHETVKDHKPGPLNLPGWTGIYAGIERLDGLLRTLQVFIATKTSVPVLFPISSTMDLVDRVLSARQPSNTKDSRIRPEVGRDERDGLTAGLPQLHISAMNLLFVMAQRMGSAFAALAHPALEQIFRIFDDEEDVDEIRLAAYRVVAQVLVRFGPLIPKTLAKSIARCLVSACGDILPLRNEVARGEEASSTIEQQPGHQASISNADSYLKPRETHHSVFSTPTAVQAAARELIPVALTRLPDGFLSEVVRIQIDNTSITTNDKEAMLASVMRTGTNRQAQKMTTSILPMLARAHTGDLGVETLLRPQLPLLQPRSIGNETLDNEEEDLHGPQDSLEDTPSGFHQHNFGFNSIEPKDPVEPKHGIPSKRAWQDDPTPDLTGGSDMSTRGSAKLPEAGVSEKRARLTHDHLEPVLGSQDGSTAPISTAPPAVDAGVGEIDVPKSSISEAIGAAGAQFDFQQEGDEESDFEMPTLHLGLDSDEEDEEEEVEGDEEDEEDGG